MIKSKFVLTATTFGVIVWGIWLGEIAMAVALSSKLPSVTIGAIHYQNRDLDVINPKLEEFDNALAKEGIDLRNEGYIIELRLLKK